jgi:hypothetical protein
MHLTTSEAEKICKKLQIELVDCKHHVRGFLVVDGKRILPVHYSNGRKELPGDVPHLFRRSLHLDTDEFLNLLRCSLSRDSYIILLRKRGLLSS